MDGISEKLNSLFAGGFLRLTLSCPSGNTYKKVVFKPGGKGFFVELFADTKVFHENLSGAAAFTRALELLSEHFKNADCETADMFLYMRRSKSGRLLTSEKKKPASAETVISAHNRRKNYIFGEDDPIPVLTELGVFTSEGKVSALMYDKFKQINRYIEFIDDIVSKDDRPVWNIIYFGCGKSYLTFVLYHYLVCKKHRRAYITGLDLKEDVIERCSALAEKHGCEGLTFLLGSIENYMPQTPPDMVISLHACDTATDYAIYNSIQWGSAYILAVPCCQHELNASLPSDTMPVITRYALLRERFAALATDALRARLLEFSGYRVDVAEFIDISHSPKNILIRARKIDNPPAERKSAAKEDIKSLVELIGDCQTLFRLIFPNGFKE